MNKHFFRRTKTKKQTHNVLLDNFIFDMQSCNVHFSNGVELHVKRGKSFKIIPQSKNCPNLSNENLSLTFADVFCQSSVFFFILDSEGTGGAYEEKRIKMSVVGSEGNGRKTTLGEILLDLGQHVGSLKKNFKLKSKFKLSKKIG